MLPANVNIDFFLLAHVHCLHCRVSPAGGIGNEHRKGHALLYSEPELSRMVSCGGTSNMRCFHACPAWPVIISQSLVHHYSGRCSKASRAWEPEFCVPGRAVEILEEKWVKEPISEVFGFWALVSNFGVRFWKISGECRYGNMIINYEYMRLVWGKLG